MQNIIQIGNFSNLCMLEIVGLSSDKKPIDKMGHFIIADRSAFIEIDTCRVFLYSRINSIWYEI